jgi:hypothetical protein
MCLFLSLTHVCRKEIDMTTISRQIMVAVAAVASLIGAGCSSGGSAHVNTPAAVTPGAAPATTAGATQILNEVAVNSSGQPINGYHEINTGGSTQHTVDCTEPSPAAVSDNIYSCAPTAASADVCWPTSGLDLLCMNDPWAKELHRVRASAPLPPVSPRDRPIPVALLLDDGTHCRLRNGGAWGYRYDDLRGFYNCGLPLAVLAPMNTDPIDRSSAVWTVKVGPDGARDPSSPPPVTHPVITAWFASH